MQGEIKLAARQVRVFLEGVWPAWHAERGEATPLPPSAYTCGRSSTFLRRVLDETCGLAAVVEGGTPDAANPARGFLGRLGWASHSWVEVEGLIVDVTADQFGAPPVIVARLADHRYRAGEDPALPIFKADRAAIVERTWPLWLGSPQRTMLVSLRTESEGRRG